MTKYATILFISTLFTLSGRAQTYNSNAPHVNVLVRENDKYGPPLDNIAIDVVGDEDCKDLPGKKGMHRILLKGKGPGDQLMLFIENKEWEVINKEDLYFVISSDPKKIHVLYLRKKSPARVPEGITTRGRSYVASPGNSDRALLKPGQQTNRLLRSLPRPLSPETEIIQDTSLEAEALKDSFLLTNDIDRFTLSEKKMALKKSILVKRLMAAGLRANQHFQTDSALSLFKKAYEIDTSNIDALRNILYTLTAGEVEQLTWLDKADSLFVDGITERFKLFLLLLQYSPSASPANTSGKRRKELIGRAFALCAELTGNKGVEQAECYNQLGNAIGSTDSALAFACFKKADSVGSQNYATIADTKLGEATYQPRPLRAGADTFYQQSLSAFRKAIKADSSNDDLFSDYWAAMSNNAYYLLSIDSARSLNLFADLCFQLLDRPYSESEFTRISVAANLLFFLEGVETTTMDSWVVVFKRYLLENNRFLQKGNDPMGIALFDLFIAHHYEKGVLPVSFSKLRNDFLKNAGKAIRTDRTYAALFPLLLPMIPAPDEFIVALAESLEKDNTKDNHYSLSLIESVEVDLLDDSTTRDALLNRLMGHYKKALGQFFGPQDMLNEMAKTSVADKILSGKLSTDRPEDAVEFTRYVFDFLRQRMDSSLAATDLTEFSKFGLPYLCEAYINAGQTDDVERIMDSVLAHFMASFTMNEWSRDALSSVLSNSFLPVVEFYYNKSYVKDGFSIKKEKIERLLYRYQVYENIVCRDEKDPMLVNILHKKEARIEKILKDCKDSIR